MFTFQPKKKKKDKKKHKHKHKHKHDHKHIKDKKINDIKDPNKMKMKEETLSSVSSSPSPPPGQPQILQGERKTRFFRNFQNLTLFLIHCFKICTCLPFSTVQQGFIIKLCHFLNIECIT